MKRLVVLFLCVFMMFGTVFAAVDSVDSSSQTLNEMGLLLNVTEEDLSIELTREVGITMILKALGYTQEDANEAAEICPFTDVNGWSKGWTSLAYQLGITTGVKEGVFSPEESLSKKEFIAFQLRALGYDKEETWNKTQELGVSAKLVSEDTSIDDKIFTKKQAAEVMFNALSSTSMSSGKTLIEELVSKKSCNGGNST